MKLKKKSEHLLSVENLTNNIVCEFALCTYLLDRCLHEFNVVYVQRKKITVLLYYNNTVHTFKNKNTRKSLKDTFVCHFLFISVYS